MKKLFLVFIIMNVSLFAQSSNLYQFKEYKETLRKGTRTIAGKPGKNYWINRTDYKIKVDFDTKTKYIKGEEELTYYNNSPDTLTRMVFRIYQDFYKKGTPRDWDVYPGYLNNGVKISDLKINGIEINSKYSMYRTGTNLIVRFPKKLKISPKSKNSISLKFEYQFPKTPALRMGTFDSTSSFVGHWYPQVSVYDDIKGWDYFNYYGTCEFYNDFGNFDVEISVPKNFVVWATGVLQNPKEVLQEEYCNRYFASNKSDEVIKIIAQEDLQQGNITTQNDINIWKYKAKMVPDFAFALSDHYLWDRVSGIVDSLTGRRVSMGAAYKIKSDDFYLVAEVSKKTVEYFSNDLPGIPYPWPEVTVFNGVGGMEFPMMANDGSSENWDAMVGVTSHEIAHTYMPFYLGTNEREYAFMDEGWAVMLPFDLQDSLMEGRNPRLRNHLLYEYVAGTQADIPPMVPSTQTRGTTYKNIAYNRPAVAYDFLAKMMGRKNFQKALQEYGKRWAEKHPTPYDFFFTMDYINGESLEWFWKPWFFEFGYPDIAIKSVEKNIIKIEKVGLLPTPIVLKITYADNSTEKINRSLDIWKNGSTEIEIKTDNTKKIKSVELGDQLIPDSDRTNNKFNL